MPKLNQIIAVESGTKTKAERELSDLYKSVQNPELFKGFVKQYRPLDEEGEKFPSESKNVQMTAREALSKARSALSHLVDITASKDYANCHACADVVVDGVTLIEKAPVSYLLFLEKKLTDIHTLVSKIPVLDAAESWTLDQNDAMFRTEPVETVRTKKVQRALVLHPPTVEHPAQTQLITEDVTVGYWKTTKISGAVTSLAQSATLSRIEALQRAVKFAREEANQAEAREMKVADKIFGWIFESK